MRRGFLVLILILVAATATAAEIVRTPVWMTIHGSATCNGAPLFKGDEVRAYTADGLLVGRFTIAADTSEKYGFMPIYGDDPQSAAKDGAIAGDLLRVVLFRVSEGTERPALHMTVDPLVWKSAAKSLRIDVMF
ncbi:MAG: hypothetical protein WC899_05590 [bacterium]|jgi:hypothetical protein|nr:hypothetical protein [Ignavibacteriaceae bacterium]